MAQWRWARMKMQFLIVRKCDESFREICSGKTEQKVFSDCLIFWVNKFLPTKWIRNESFFEPKPICLASPFEFVFIRFKGPGKDEHDQYMSEIGIVPGNSISCQFDCSICKLDRLQFLPARIEGNYVSDQWVDWNKLKSWLLYDIFSFWELVILVINIKFFVRCVQIVFVNYISLDMPLFHRTDMETKLWYLSTETFFIFILFLIWNILYIKANYWHHHHDKVSWANMQHAPCHLSFEFHKISFP